MGEKKAFTGARGSFFITGVGGPRGKEAARSLIESLNSDEWRDFDEHCGLSW